MRSSVVVGRVWLMADGTTVSHRHWNSTELQCVSISLQLFVGFVRLFVFRFCKVKLATKRHSLFLNVFIAAGKVSLPHL